MTGDRPVAVVSGAAGDIGAATARLLAERGWSLGLVDHPASNGALAAVADACAARGAPTWRRTFDVVDGAGVRAGLAACADALGPPRGIFANAGVQGPFVRVDRYPLDAARHVVDVNVTGTLHVVAAAGALMSGGGAIVCTASMAGVSGAPNMAAYSASKAAVIGLVKSAAKDLAPLGIRVNAVSPAFIGPGRMWESQVAAQAAAPSPYYADDPDEVARQMIAMVPLRRYGLLDEVARVVAFLLSDEASYVTGVNVEIAGGST